MDALRIRQKGLSNAFQLSRKGAVDCFTENDWRVSLVINDHSQTAAAPMSRAEKTANKRGP